MKFIASFLFLALTNFSFAHTHKELKTVKNIEIDRYLGRWHQVAAIPAWFQKKCVADTTADYQKVEDGLSVTNTCRKKDGSNKVALGKARVNHEFSDNARLQVTFVNLFNKWWVWLFGGDYWVIDLAKDYSYSVVGEPKRQYLWILSREDNMKAEQFAELDLRIKKQGYDTCKVIVTQEGEHKGKTLCSFNHKKLKRDNS